MITFEMRVRPKGISLPFELNFLPAQTHTIILMELRSQCGVMNDVMTTTCEDIQICKMNLNLPNITFDDDKLLQTKKLLREGIENNFS